MWVADILSSFCCLLSKAKIYLSVKYLNLNLHFKKSVDAALWLSKREDQGQPDLYSFIDTSPLPVHLSLLIWMYKTCFYLFKLKNLWRYFWVWVSLSYCYLELSEPILFISDSLLPIHFWKVFFNYIFSDCLSCDHSGLFFRNIIRTLNL